MTLGEIYNRVCFLLWGNSNVPAASSTALLGTSGIIANIHKEIQRRLNFWFMYKSAIIEVEPFTQSYSLPGDYKKFIAAMWDIEDEEGFSNPLSVISNDEAHRRWKAPIGHAEYPEYIEVAGASVVLYPEPNPSYPYESDDAEFDEDATRNLHVVYWGYEGTIPSDSTEYLGYTDNVTVFGFEAIINYTVSRMALALGEESKAVSYEALAREAVDTLLIEHEQKMRKQLTCRARLYPYGQDIYGY